MQAELHTELSDGVLTVVIDRQYRMNAIDPVTLAAIRQSLTEAASDEAVRVVVISGAGTRAFSAGDDLKALADASPAEGLANTHNWLRLGEEIENHPCPVIAAIEGHCLGGGLELALSCDYRVASQTASLALPEVAIDALPSGGGIFRLPRVVGLGRAREMILFGRKLDATTALAWGLVSEVVDEGAALTSAIAVAHRVAASASRTTLARAKQAVSHSYALPNASAGIISYLADAAQLSSAEFREAVTSFGR